MSTASDSDDWETMLDSGQLDANIKKMTILQRPKPTVNNGTVNVLCSDDPRQQFRSTEPVIKIMKRPDSGNVANSGQAKPKVEPKTLKQREQEYAEARQRILGEGDNNGVGDNNTSNIKPAAVKVTTSKNVNNAANCTRAPKGPPSDGSRGFQNR